MKKILIAALAIISVASCSKNEVIEQPDPVAIAFEQPFVGKSTKATDYTADNLTDFAVYGYVNQIGGLIFHNEKVSKSGTTWGYDNTQYWTPDKQYHFTAIAPASQGANYNATAVNGGTLKFDNTSADVDLLYAYQTASTGSEITQQPNPVAFSFGHMLSRIKFSFTNGMVAENASIKISNVAVTDAYKEGTVTFASGAYSSWDVSGENNKSNSVSFGSIADAIDKNKSEETAHMYFIPAAKTTYSLTFTATLYQGTVEIGSKTHTVTLPATELKQNLSYDFKATLSQENVLDALYPITFTVTEFTSWSNFGEEIGFPEETTVNGN